jgi:putative heme-binding domain-containing protein
MVTLSLPNVLVWSLCVGLMGVGEAAGQEASEDAARTSYARADIDYGRKLYGAHCSTCHGADGSAVPSVALGSGRFRQASSDRDLSRIITGGIAGTTMPAGRYDAAELAGLIAYLRNMKARDTGNIAPGDSSRGRRVFEVKGNCATCHRVNGRGSLTASDLSEIGAVRTAGALERALLEPAAALLPMNRTMRAVTKDGRVVTGRRLNEDTHTVQLSDERGRLVSLVKEDLRSYTLETTSRMPSYRETLAPQEFADVLAYLLSLKGLVP